MSSLVKDKELRIVYMGTPDFAVAGLKSLLAQDYKVVGVVTAADKPAGRGRKIQESAIKTYAKSKKLQILQPTNLKDDGFLDQLQKLRANLFIVVAFRMLPKVVWQIPEHGTFNLHASLLPEYRGAAPINWAIINGEKETGVTTFFIDEKIDTGNIILQKKAPIASDETAGTLHDRLMALGAETIVETVRQIDNGSVTVTEQGNSKGLKKAPKIFRDTCAIDWHAPMENIHNLIRGLSPYPAAWSTLIQGESQIHFKLFSAAKLPATHEHEIGKVMVKDKSLKVAVKNGYIELLEIQLAGKRRTMVKDLLNGYRISEGTYVRSTQSQ